MRVVGGIYGGRRLRAGRGRNTRPTSDRVREALFSTLGAAVVDAQVLDLFAGTGAIGIEALSRGAAAATFVERDPATIRVLRANLAALGISAAVHGMPAERFVALDHGAGKRFDLVFCDPPYTYASAELAALFVRLERNGGLAETATIVAERARQAAPLTLPTGPLQVADVRAYGDTVLYYVRRNTTTERSGGSSA